MAKYDELKAAIKQAIKKNGNQEITGSVLQNALLSMVDSLGENKEYKGFATPSTNPGTPAGEVFYFASTPDQYPNFKLNDENEFVTIGNGLSIIYNKADGYWDSKALFEIEQQYSNSESSVLSSSFLINYAYSFYDYYSRIKFNDSDFALSKINDSTYHVSCKKQFGRGNISSFDNTIYIYDSANLDLDIPKTCTVVLTKSKSLKAVAFNELRDKNNEPCLPLLVIINGKIIYNVLVQKTLEYVKLYITTLAQDGTGDFTDLKSLLANVDINSTVYVKKGEYNTQGLRLSKGLHFIGVSRDDVIFSYDTGLYSHAPVLENGFYENITFISKPANVKYDKTNKPGYSVHIDFMEPKNDIYFGDYFNNCKFISYCSSCVGVGMRKNFELRFNNCEFDYRGKSNTNMDEIIDARNDYKYSCLSVHNAYNTTQSYGIGTVKLQSCNLKSDFNATLTLHDSFSKDVPTDFIINNCSFISTVSHKNCIYSSEFKTYITEFKETGCTLNELSHGNNIPFLNA